MKRKFIIGVICFAFVAGVFAGGYGAGLFMDKTLKGSVVMGSSSDVGTAVSILMRLRDNKIAEAIQLLEINLDMGLSSLQDYGKIPAQKQDKGIIGVLKLAKEYRAQYPRRTKNHLIDDAVKEALSVVSDE